MPREAVQLYDLVQAGSFLEARALWEKMFPANMFFIQNSYVPSVKAATNMAGFNVGPCRKPLMPLNTNDIEKLRQALAPLGT